MVLNDKPVEKMHVFWLFNWGYRPVQSSLRLVPHYQRCDITKNTFTIHDEKSPLVISLENIQAYDLQRFYEGSGVGHTSNLRLSFASELPKSGDKTSHDWKEIFLVPADVFDHYMDDNWELKNMYEVIRCYKSGEEPTIETNPYHRMLLRRGQSERVTERNWDPNLHPSHYGSVPTVFSVLKRLVLTIIIGSIIFTFISGLIYYIVTTFF